MNRVQRSVEKIFAERDLWDGERMKISSQGSYFVVRAPNPQVAEAILDLDKEIFLGYKVSVVQTKSAMTLEERFNFVLNDVRAQEAVSQVDLLYGNPEAQYTKKARGVRKEEDEVPDAAMEHRIEAPVAIPTLPAINPTQPSAPAAQGGKGGGGGSGGGR